MPKTKTVASAKSSLSKSARRRARKAASGKRWSFETSGLELSTPFGAQKLGKTKVNSRNVGSNRRSVGGGTGATVGVAPHSMQVQTVMPRIRTELGGKYGATDILCGTEYLQSINSAEGGNIAGDIMSTILINPRAFLDTRLFQFAALYQRYKFRRLNFIYEPIANATVSGQLIGYGDYDPDNIVVDNDPLNVSTAAAHLGMRNTQVWEPAFFPFGVVDDFTSLFTSLDNANEPRLVYQGVYYLLAASDLPIAIALGNLYIDYEIELIVPVLEDAAIEQSYYYAGLTASDFTTPDPNLRPLSVSGDLSGTILPPDWVLPGTPLPLTYTASAGEFQFNPPNGSYIVLTGWNVQAAGGSTSGYFDANITIVDNVDASIPYYPFPAHPASITPSGGESSFTVTTYVNSFASYWQSAGFFTVDNAISEQTVTITAQGSVDDSGPLTGWNTYGSYIVILSVGTLFGAKKTRMVGLKEYLTLAVKKREEDKQLLERRKKARLDRTRFSVVPRINTAYAEVSQMGNADSKFQFPRSDVDKFVNSAPDLSEARFRTDYARTATEDAILVRDLKSWTLKEELGTVEPISNGSRKEKVSSVYYKHP